MEIANRTVFIVGGTSGIGRGLAQRFKDAGSTVIAGGRNPEPQDGLETVRIDVTDPDSILRARDDVLAAHPDLDVVVTMSGVMLTEDLRDPAHIAATETTRSAADVDGAQGAPRSPNPGDPGSTLTPVLSARRRDSLYRSDAAARPSGGGREPRCRFRLAWGDRPGHSARELPAHWACCPTTSRPAAEMRG